VTPAAAAAGIIALMARWSLTVRNGPKVERARFDTLPAALEALEARLDELAPQARREAIDVLRRRYEAARQVAVRGEISGPGRRRGGVDLRGDGSSEAFTGRWRRTLVELRPGETAYDGLRRALGDAEPG
jgi:hypothetical protein